MKKLAFIVRCSLPTMALLASGSSCLAQATPAAIGAPAYHGFALPNVQGTLTYSASISGRRSFGYDGTYGDQSSAVFSGNVAYLSHSAVHPFSLLYSGGYITGNTGSSSGFFQDLSFSQVLQAKRWHFVLADTVDYLPNTATAGLSGIPGVGDLGLTPIGLGTGLDQGILTNLATRVDNTTSGSAQRALTGSTSLDFSGSHSIQRFLASASGSGIETNQDSASAGSTHRIDARTSVSGNYNYSRFSYLGLNDNFASQGVNVEVRRQVTRRLTLDASVGPQYTSAVPTVGQPSSVNVAANVQLSYSAKASDFAVSYVRTTSSGSGVALGTRNDYLSATANRTIARAWRASVEASFTRANSLASIATNNFNADSEIASAQVNRSLTRYLSAFGSYTLQRQTTQGVAYALYPYSGTSQILGFGLTYSPSALHLGHE